MSRKIALANDDIDTAVIDLRQVLSQLRLGVDSKVRMDFSKYLNCESRNATIIFTEKAWFKMQMLIMKYDSEVAWHGVAYRDEDPDSDIYHITDILVYPQKVTGATVNTDQKPYEMWLMNLEDDAFNNLRMHGHSHVDMAPSPSSTDIQHREELLERLKDDMFYIFLIFNKSNTYTAAIYDYGKNVYFDTQDVDIEVESDDGDNIVDFLSSAEKLVKPEPRQTYYGNYGNYKGSPQYGHNYSGYGVQGSGTGAQSGTANKPADAKLDSKSDTSQKKGKRKEFSDYDDSDYGWYNDGYGGW